MQYFLREKGLLIKLLLVRFLPNATSETIAGFCRESLVELGLDVKKGIALCGDNTNTNVVGWFHKGRNNVYSKFKESMNKLMEDVRCPAHILYIAAHTT